MTRPARVIAVTGTGTEVGKTWWAAALARALLEHECTVALRKPVQAFAPADTVTDADVLGAATGEDPYTVCPRQRWLATPMAPPMAAVELGLPSFTIADLIGELAWPPDPVVDVGIVEGVGGLRSPLADDGDSLDLIGALAPDDVLVVAPAGLGTIHGVRLVADALAGHRLTVVLNRYDPADDLHRANRDWLRTRDGLVVETDARELAVAWA